jgi:hypothetical protein
MCLTKINFDLEHVKGDHSFQKAANAKIYLIFRLLGGRLVNVPSEH